MANKVFGFTHYRNISNMMLKVKVDPFTRIALTFKL